jgi:hypothetical protein
MSDHRVEPDRQGVHGGFMFGIGIP